MMRSRNIHPKLTLPSAVLILLLFVGGIAYQVEAPLVEHVYAAVREASRQATGRLVPDQPGTSKQALTGEAADRRDRQKVIETLLEFSEAHGVRVQLDVRLRRATGDAGNLIDAKLTGSYKGIRAWLLDVCKSSPELLVTSAHFRRGPTDGDARAEIVFDYSRE